MKNFAQQTKWNRNNNLNSKASIDTNNIPKVIEGKSYYKLNYGQFQEKNNK